MIPGGVFTLVHDKVRELKLRHTHWIGPVLRQPVAHIGRGQNPGDILLLAWSATQMVIYEGRRVRG